jgi:hypothetical protein
MTVSREIIASKPGKTRSPEQEQRFRHPIHRPKPATLLGRAPTAKESTDYGVSLISELRRDSRYGMNLVVLHPGGRDEEVIEPAGG